jgi:branched-chain amino acid transport system substrate-binding protein
MGRPPLIWIGHTILVVGALFVILLACSTREGAQPPIQIGGVYALTGKAASFGKDVKNGVDLSVEAINQRGGIAGRKLQVVSEDTQSDPKTAVSAFEKLITLNRIPAAVGFITSSEALACAPVAERSKVVMITPIAGTPELREAGDFVFRTRESGLLQSFKIAQYVYETLGIGEVAVLCENAANAVGYRDAFITKFEELGGKIVTSLTYEEGQTDFRIVLTRLKGSQPRAVYIPGVGKVIGRILKQARELELDTKFFSSAGLEDPVLFEIAGDAANGIIYGAPAFSLGSSEPKTSKFGRGPGRP